MVVNSKLLLPGSWEGVRDGQAGFFGGEVPKGRYGSG